MTAEEIYQAALDRVSQAVLARDFDAYVAMIDLPYLVYTADAHFVLRSVAELEPTFRTLSQGLRERGVAHYERVCRRAAFRGPHRIEGLHYTHMLGEGQRIQAPHASEASLVLRDDGRWRFTEARYPFCNTDWPLSATVIFDPASHGHTAGAA